MPFFQKNDPLPWDRARVTLLLLCLSLLSLLASQGLGFGSLVGACVLFSEGPQHDYCNFACGRLNRPALWVRLRSKLGTRWRSLTRSATRISGSTPPLPPSVSFSALSPVPDLSSPVGLAPPPLTPPAAGGEARAFGAFFSLRGKDRATFPVSRFWILELKEISAP